jgi:Peptidase family M23
MKASTPKIALVLLTAAVQPAYAGTCLSVDVMNPAGERITSPYGVNRTGHKGASPGYHQGIDIVNSEAQKSKIFSGSSGKVLFRSFRGGGVIADVTSGDTRFEYLHMSTTKLDEGQSAQISAGDQVGVMGCEGMKVCAPHLHLYVILKGSVLAAAGQTGRVWKEYAPKSTAPMTADAIKEALPTAWYYVNPEPFLAHQIPISNPYPDMEGGKRSMSLPRTCSPTTDGPASPTASETPSEATTQSQESAIAGAASIQTGSPDYAVKVANQDNRSLYIELAKQNATELTANVAAVEYQERMNAALAQLVALYALDARPTAGPRSPGGARP